MCPAAASKSASPCPSPTEPRLCRLCYPRPVDHVTILRQPDLHAPVAVIAFAGWNDASSAATNAARFVLRRLGARKFATIDPEPFFDFREVRPDVRIDLRGTRQVVWPANELYYARNPLGPHDVVIAVGVEPNLRWRTFTEIYTALFRDLGVTMAVSLGALLADVPHSRPVRVNGAAADPETAARLNLITSRYEGPTGIIGVLQDALRRAGFPAASLWANVPHYVSTSQNPPATLALLERLEPLLGLTFDYTELRAAGERFVAEVDTAVGANSEVASYVARLEEAVDAGESPDEPQLPAPADLVLDIEEFLRQNRERDT